MRLPKSLTVAAGVAALAVVSAVFAGPGAAVAAKSARAASQAAELRNAAALRNADVVIRPDVLHIGRGHQQPPTTAFCMQAYQVACYEPDQIRQAYNLPVLYRRGITGKGSTIVIVDSFGSPTIEHDLGVFDRAFGYPAPPSFTIIQPAGPVPAYDPTNSDMVGWAGETTLDVEYAHTVAPQAKILLVETPVSETEGVTGFPEIVTAEEYVIDHHLGGVISQSFGATEQTFLSRSSVYALRSAYRDAYRHHVTVLASSGDSGATDVGLDQTTYFTYPVTSWPDSDPLVTGVGGTRLSLNARGDHTAPDVVWNDTYSKATNEIAFGDAGPNPLAGGGGKSVIFRRPSYQDRVRNIVGDRRGVPDIAMSAACDGAVDTYQSFGGAPAGWYPSCGTSEASPLFAGVVALADQVAGHPLGLINPALYALSAAHAPGLVDVVSGNNTVSFTQHGQEDTVQGFRARPGYDLASGVGTINAAYFVPELALAAGGHRGRG
jgi:subtilase family serine protease